jgi:hypothetical protein
VPAGPARPATGKVPAQRATTRREASRPIPRAPAKSNTGLVVGGAVGGLVILVVLIAALSSGARRPSEASNKKSAKPVPVDVAGMVRAGTGKCEEGLAVIQRCEGMMDGRNLATAERGRLKADLERGLALLVEGNNLLEQAGEKSGEKYGEVRYNKAIKAARMKIGELGSVR